MLFNDTSVQFRPFSVLERLDDRDRSVLVSFLIVEFPNKPILYNQYCTFMTTFYCIPKKMVLNASKFHN